MFPKANGVKYNIITLIEFDSLKDHNVDAIDLFLVRNMNLKFYYYGGDCIVALKDKKEIVGVGYSRNGILEYLCTKWNYRNKGIGTKILTRLLEKNEVLRFKVPSCTVLTEENVVCYPGCLSFYYRNFSTIRISNHEYEIRLKANTDNMKLVYYAFHSMNFIGKLYIFKYIFMYFDQLCGYFEQ
jgi:GNAT superfamily N-acetyltransferase